MCLSVHLLQNDSYPYFLWQAQSQTFWASDNRELGLPNCYLNIGASFFYWCADTDFAWTAA